jgi:hypothetical protein
MRAARQVASMLLALSTSIGIIGSDVNFNSIRRKTAKETKLKTRGVIVTVEFGDARLKSSRNTELVWKKWLILNPCHRALGSLTRVKAPA